MVDPKYANINSDTNKAVRWMSFKDGMFTVKPGVEKDRHDWLDRVVEDDDRVGFLHVKRDDNKISSAFDDAKVVEMLKALAKKASKDASEVSTSIVQLLDEAVAKVERVARPRVSADTE
jgi:UDP-N-acetylmuramyl pentapeptide synthase